MMMNQCQHVRMDKKTYIENSINELLIKLAPALCLGGALLFLCLSALDYVSTPENFRTFLAYRVTVSGLLLITFFILHKYTFRNILIYQLLLFMALLGSAITVELMILKTGGHLSSYYIGIGLIGIWGISFIPVRSFLSFLIMLTIYGTYVLPIVATETITDVRTFFTANAFLLALLSSSFALRYIHFHDLVNELGLKYDLEQHKIQLEDQVNDRTAKLSDSVEHLQKEMVERERFELAVKKSSDEWRATVDATTDVIMMLNADYKVIRVNKAATLFYNLSYKDLIGTSLFQLFPSDFLPEGANKRSVLKHSLEHEEGTVYLSDKRIWVSFSIDPIRDDTRQVLGGVFTMRDITERIKAEEEQRNLQTELLQIQKMDSIGRLAGGVAHDFNNILSAIIGFSQLALMRLPDDHPAVESIKIVYDSGERAASLTRQLLAFSRKQVLEMKVVNLNTIIENMAKMLRRVIGENIVLDINLQKPIRNILADAGQMEQVLMNLLVNARDAMPSGGRVKVKTEEIFLREEIDRNITPGSYVMVSVTDTGTGMSKEVQERIFEPFYTTKGMGKGTGLGMSTVYGIVKQHDGHVTVHSEQGRGSTVKVYFPLVNRETDMIQVEKHSKLMRGTETILVVDDEPSIRKLLLQTMQPLGYKLLDAASGEDAVKVSNEYPGTIDLLVTDVVMSGMNGMQLADTLRQRRTDIKVIFISGYIDTAMVQQDVVDKKLILMQKPLIPTVLAAKVREVLDKKSVVEKPAGTEPDLSGMRILYAEDDESSRLLVRRYLEQAHGVLDICENGQIAVNKFQSGSYDLVLMDMQMPMMDGFAASRAIRSWEASHELKATPIIALTGLGGTGEVKAMLSAGCTSYMMKPIKREVLLGTVSGYCPHQHALDADSGNGNDPGNIVKIDKDLQDLVTGYLQSRQEDVTVLCGALERNDYESIRVLGHSMKGSGGSYGFDTITEIGKQIEIAAGNRDREAMRKWIDELSHYLSGITIIYG
jgi:PAS domain S-box-containing protein